jgi:acyl-[acyl-carrier-protein]-phospholipid O-acyltransferase/long-chain-fatty-acid--[acyl-carrier-protein] ligase
LVISIISVAVAAILAFLILAANARRRWRISYLQALGLSVFRFFFGARFSGLDHVGAQSGPVLYAVLEQSRIDRLILRAILPVHTFHVALEPGDRSAILVAKSVLTGKGLVCVYFPKEIEPSGKTLDVMGEIGLIASDAGAHCVALHIRGTRFSLFSKWSASKAPRTLLPSILVRAQPAEMLPASRDLRQLAFAMMDGLAAAKFRSANVDQTLVGALIAAARRFGPSRTISEDAMGGKLSYRKLLTGVRALAGLLQTMTAKGEAVGILLPNSNGAVIALFALNSASRVAAMLNYSAGIAALISAIKSAKIRIVLTSRAFVDKAGLEATIEQLVESGSEIRYIEELGPTIGLFDKIQAALLWRWPLVATSASKIAVILFTSGTEGTPKGVALTSQNLVANAAQADSRIDIAADDVLFNPLPVFHSFGLTGGMLLPLFYGIRLFLYPSPLHYKIIPSLARKTRPTIMFGTDAFLNGYARAAREGDFGSLRLIVAGAEAVKPETRRLFLDRFGVVITEGYGMTEAAPVVAVNSSIFSKDGSVGRLLPGMEARIEAIDGISQGGRLYVSGPNVMQGYYLESRPGKLQPQSGKWHDTGDIVRIDELGFISIAGRAKRFAKIAGEMVSLGAVEMIASGLWPEANHAALSLPDSRKGERIVLVTTKMPALREELIAYSKRYGATELMIPNDIINVDTIPVLASGKTDYQSTEKIARDHKSV